MAYNAVQQTDHDDLDALSERSSSASPRPSNPPSYSQLASSATVLSTKDGLFLENTSDATDLSQMINSIAFRSTKSSANYQPVEDDDYEELKHPTASVKNDVALSQTPISTSTSQHDPTEGFVPLHIHKPRPIVSVHAQATQSSANQDFTKRSHPLPSLPSKETPLRTASGRSTVLRHPTPDLHTLQGAYVGNIRNLEATAERLSMTSSIDDAIRELHEEQKRSDSRRSSVLSGSPPSFSHEVPAFTRKFSNSSIIEMNKISRGGGNGFAPSGLVKSPKGSLASKTSRYGNRPEPELEGRPLDSFATTSKYSQATTSPVMSRSASIAEVNEGPSTMALPTTEEEQILEVKGVQPRPKSPSPSTTTFDQAQKMFEDFDGVHTAQDGPDERKEESGRKTPSQLFAERTVSQLFTETTLLEQQNAESLHVGEDPSRRMVSTGNRRSIARPQTYADPDTGQQMVYYPAPVPMMLNLPQKLSKLPSSVARNKRRSQILSDGSVAARQSAVWLSDVVEGEGDASAQDSANQNHEYIPPHQRASMGGRRLTQDLTHIPPQLRANAFFEQPGMSQTVELRGHSAVETLDSILDASASAPVTAFTDHAFAGHLGEEVYGKEPLRLTKNRSSTQLLNPAGEESKKRLSTFSIFRGNRASSVDLLSNVKRSSTMPTLLARDEEEAERAQDATHLGGSDIEDFREHEDGVEHEDGEENNDGNHLYYGQPTTLLAELQLRKQQQKYRTRPVATAYPNGMHSTLLELDTVAQIEQKSRKQKRVNLAWEGATPNTDVNDDEDVPLAMLYANKVVQDRNRPLGLMERKERDDNEPLSARRDRLQGRRPGMPRSTTIQSLPVDAPEEEDEPLAQRIQRLKAQGGTATGLPTARPVSGDFATEMMGSFGGDAKGSGLEIGASPSPDEEGETLGQRKRRLQADREARAKEVSGATVAGAERPPINKRLSMADILQAHPVTGTSDATTYGLSKPVNGLLGLHEQQKSARRTSTLLNLENPKPQQFKSGMFNDGRGGFAPGQPYQPLYNQHTAFHPQHMQPSMNFSMYQNQMAAPFANPYAMGYTTNAMHMGYSPNLHANPMVNMMHLGMGNGMQPLNDGQIDMVERWRRSVMQ
ncbi:hypothetical protein BP5796_08932 [Coleophoma crateriformis]|uniref:Uncharacterized protein n=1 Tax=Coleophoma crateriformis TaxID=565419 RepID=A0A3D8R2J4_9HELO|nr:hypothetical protein BP5796_08932 [Coleophoma crateriformis]